MNKLFLFATVIMLLASCSDNKTASATDSSNSDSTKMMNNDQKSREQRNVQTVKNALQAVNSHNAEQIIAVNAPDAVDYGDGNMAPVKSRDSMKAFIAQLFKSIPDYKGENFDYYADENTVIAVGD